MFVDDNQNDSFLAYLEYTDWLRVLECLLSKGDSSEGIGFNCLRE